MATLEELEGDVWAEPSYDSYLVTTCHKLRKKHLADFTVEDLRIMVGQGISLKYLIPRALGVLEADPFASGDFFPGDLLSALIRDRNWFELEFFRTRVESLARSALATLEVANGQTIELGEHDTIEPGLAKNLINEINLYLNRPKARRPRKGKGD